MQKKLKIFLIEDAVRIRSMLIEILQQTGKMEVVGFAEGEKEALAQLRSQDWDVAILDVRLSEGTGFGVLSGLQQDGKAYGKRFVFSNNFSAALGEKTKALGAHGFFDKSEDISGLLSELEVLAG